MVITGMNPLSCALAEIVGHFVLEASSRPQWEAPFAVPARVHLYDDVVRTVAPPPAPRPVARPHVAALVE